MSKKMPAWFNRECGGRVNRDSGGRTVISEDSKRAAADLRKQAAEKDMNAPKELLTSIPGIIGGAAVDAISKGRAGKLLGKVISGASAAGGIGAGASDIYSGVKLRGEASRIERGEVDPDRADRKRGGRIGKSKKKS